MTHFKVTETRHAKSALDNNDPPKNKKLQTKRNWRITKKKDGEKVEIIM
jgi:hypothetical protein